MSNNLNTEEKTININLIKTGASMWKVYIAIVLTIIALNSCTMMNSLDTLVKIFNR